MKKTIITFGLDKNMRALIEDQVNVYTHCSAPLHEASQNILDQTDIAIIFVFSHVDQELCEKTDFDAIISLGAGTDHIDKSACHQKGIIVCNTPHYGSQTVAEHTFALLLSFTRHLQSVENESLDFPRHEYLGQDLSGKTFGAIGTGGIGKAAVRIAQGFDMHTIGYDIKQDEQLVKNKEFQYTTLENVLKSSHYVGLYLPAVPETENIINEETLHHMQEDTVLINTARAALVDHKALLTALNQDKLGGALLDVVDREYEEKFFKHSRTIVTPHHAFYTEQALANMAQQANEAIEAIKQEKAPRTAI